MKNRRYLPHEDCYVPREDYYRRWQVDPECVKADSRELGRMKDLIVRTAVYRLIALREATVVGEQDWLPDPRLVNPELRARSTRHAMDILARRLTKFASEARGAGWSWGELARSVTAHEEFPNWTISGAEAFESVTGQAPGSAGMRTLTWRCVSCNQQITDRGPYGHPGDCESGHVARCTRHDQEVAAYELGARPAIDLTLLRVGSPGEVDNSTENLCRAIRSRRCGCARCFYCERILASRRHEHDHFPVPRSAGGDRVVPTCLDCHELKDQYSLRAWPHADLAAAWHGILTCLKHEGFPDGDELAHLRMIDWWEEQPDSSDEAVIVRWPELRPLSRVLYAKVRAGKERHKRAHALPEDTTAFAASHTD